MKYKLEAREMCFWRMMQWKVEKKNKEVLTEASDQRKYIQIKKIENSLVISSEDRETHNHWETKKSR